MYFYIVFNSSIHGSGGSVVAAVACSEGMGTGSYVSVCEWPCGSFSPDNLSSEVMFFCRHMSMLYIVLSTASGIDCDVIGIDFWLSKHTLKGKMV